jgi:hypothetical protein
MGIKAMFQTKNGREMRTFSALAASGMVPDNMCPQLFNRIAAQQQQCSFKLMKYR